MVSSGSPRRRFLKLSAAAAASVTFGFPAESVVGLIVPSSNGPVPPEARTLYPAGVRFLAAGIGLARTLPEDFDRLIEPVLPAADKLSKARSHAIVLMAPSISFYKGAAFNRRLSDELNRATGVPSITASTAIVEGLQAVQARRLAVATVYTDEISLHLQGFLEQSGFEVVIVKGLGIERFEERPPGMESVTNEELLDFCVNVQESRPEADALLICSGYLPALDLIVPIEKRCRIPVVSATPHALRAGVRLTGFAGRVSGLQRCSTAKFVPGTSTDMSVGAVRMSVCATASMPRTHPSIN